MGGRNSRGFVAVGLACVLAGLAGCGGGKAEAAKDDKRLEQQIGIDDDGIRLKQTAAENLMRDCMKAQGFDYVPQDPAAQQAALVGAPGMSKEDFQKQFGYGITTLYEQRRKLAVAGPNKAIRDSLSEADRKAYDHALHGDDPTATFSDALDSGDYSRLGGCVKTATDQVFGGADVLSSLSEKLDELDDSIAADQRMVRAQEKWRACVKDATGNEYEDAESIEDDIKQRFEKVAGSVVPPGEVAPPGTQVDMAALAKLQQDELDLFRKDSACERKLIDPVETKIRQQKEAKFKSDNADLLSKVKPLGT